MLGNILNIIIYILFHYNIITIPSYLPTYIQDWLKFRKDRSEKTLMRAYLDLEIRDTVSYIFTIILALIYVYINT